jgi:hypothetical protein
MDPPPAEQQGIPLRPGVWGWILHRKDYILAALKNEMDELLEMRKGLDTRDDLLKDGNGTAKK